MGMSQILTGGRSEKRSAILFLEGVWQVLKVNLLPACWEWFSVSQELRCREEKHFSVFFDAHLNPFVNSLITLNRNVSGRVFPYGVAR